MGFKKITPKHLPVDHSMLKISSYRTCHTTFALHLIKHKYDSLCFSSQIKLGSGGR